MASISLPEVCRLCLKNDHLIWVFDRKTDCLKNLNEVVLITTGVEILVKDKISQKICEKCHQISIKMFQFRQQSLKNNNFLQEQYKELMENNKEKLKSKVFSENQSETHPVEDVPKKDIVARPAYKIHPSITQLFKVYPQIKLPTICLKKHIEPFVSMEMDAVENYFKRKNLNFQKHTQHALKLDKKVAMKKTSVKDSVKTTPVVLKNKTKPSDRSDPLQIPSEQVASTSSAPTTTEKIHPINIKRHQGKDKSRYKIVSVSKIMDDKSDKDSVKSSDESKNSASRKRYAKRKLSDSDFSSEPEIKKPSIIESVGLTPKKPDDGPGTLYVEKSVALYICSICNSVQYTEKGLRKHQEKHLRCQFCKVKLKTMVSKTEHIKSACLIKNMMNNLPSVLLEKMEMNLAIRGAYRTAFKQFPSIPELERPEEKKKVDIEPDIIEILSDEESNVDQLEPTRALAENSVRINNNVTSDPIIVEASTSSVSTPVLSTLEVVSASSPSAPVPAIQEMAISSSVVKPDIKIKNNNLLDSIPPIGGDIKLVKELLVKYKNIKLETDCCTQTELPNSASININHSDQTTELKFLKHLLSAYKIPVKIQKGPFNVEYSYQQVAKRLKKLDMWNDLIPVDVKCPNRTVVVASYPSVHTPRPDLECMANKTTPPNYAVENEVGVVTVSTNRHSPVSAIPLPASVDVGGLNAPIIPQAPKQNVPLSLPDSDINMSTQTTTKTYLPQNYSLSSQMQLLNNVNNAETAPNSITSTDVSTVASEAVNVPIAGTIRVKSVWELK